MGKTYRRRNTRKGEHRLRVVGVRHDPPDARRLSKTLLGIALQRAEAEAAAQAEQGVTIPVRHIQDVDASLPAAADQGEGGAGD